MRGHFSLGQAAQALLAAWPLDIRLGLYVTAPTDNALGVEYAAQGYIKQGVRRVGSMPADPPPRFVTVDPVQFGPFGPVGMGAEIGWVAAFPVTGGVTAVDMLMYWELDEHKTPLAGDSLVIEAGALGMVMDADLYAALSDTR
jgi:hypothetical protein